MEGTLVFESFKLKQIILYKLEGEQLEFPLLFRMIAIKKTDQIK